MTLCRDLVRLNLGKNKLTRIPHAAIRPLKFLKILELSENQIKEMHAGDFEGNDSLDHLVLNYNQLGHLGGGYFRGLNKLTTLYIDHNGITTIDRDAFEGLEENLASLTLTGNSLKVFPSVALRRIHRYVDCK